MTPAFALRFGGSADAEPVADLLARSGREPWTAEMIRETISSQGSFLVLASCPEDGALVRGALFGVFLEDEAQVLQVAVDPGSRRLGLGRRLMGAGHGLLAGRGVARVTLEVRAGNAPAIALYEALGYCEIGRRPAFYSDGEDALALALDLAHPPLPR